MLQKKKHVCDVSSCSGDKPPPPSLFQLPLDSKKYGKQLGGSFESILLQYRMIQSISYQAPKNSSQQRAFLSSILATLIHSIWTERNARRHGEQPRDEQTLIKLVDKTVLLRLLSVHGKGKTYLDEGLITWFGTKAQDSSSA